METIIHNSDETICYYNGSNLHRLDGPAVIFKDGYCEWYIDGKQFSKEEFDRAISLKVFW